MWFMVSLYDGTDMYYRDSSKEHDTQGAPTCCKQTKAIKRTNRWIGR